MNGPIFFSQPNRLFFLAYFTDVNTFQKKVRQVSEIPNFSLMNLFRSLGQRKSMKNVMKIWWLEVFDNKIFLAYRKALQTYFWHRDKKKSGRKLSYNLLSYPFLGCCLLKCLHPDRWAAPTLNWYQLLVRKKFSQTYSDFLWCRVKISDYKSASAKIS